MDVDVSPFVRPFSVWLETRRDDALDLATTLDEPDLVDEGPKGERTDGYVWIVVRGLRDHAAKEIAGRSSTDERIVTARVVDARGELVSEIARPKKGRLSAPG